MSRVTPGPVPDNTEELISRELPRLHESHIVATNKVRRVQAAENDQHPCIESTLNTFQDLASSSAIQYREALEKLTQASKRRLADALREAYRLQQPNLPLPVKIYWTCMLILAFFLKETLSIGAFMLAGGYLGTAESFLYGAAFSMLTITTGCLTGLLAVRYACLKPLPEFTLPGEVFRRRLGMLGTALSFLVVLPGLLFVSARSRVIGMGTGLLDFEAVSFMVTWDSSGTWLISLITLAAFIVACREGAVGFTSFTPGLLPLVEAAIQPALQDAKQFLTLKADQLDDARMRLLEQHDDANDARDERQENIDDAVITVKIHNADVQDVIDRARVFELRDASQTPRTARTLNFDQIERLLINPTVIPSIQPTMLGAQNFEDRLEACFERTVSELQAQHAEFTTTLLHHERLQTTTDF